MPAVDWVRLPVGVAGALGTHPRFVWPRYIFTLGRGDADMSLRLQLDRDLPAVVVLQQQANLSIHAGFRRGANDADEARFHFGISGKQVRDVRN